MQSLLSSNCDLKTDKIIWKFPPLSKRIPSLLNSSLFLSNFFMTPLFVQILKTSDPLILGGGNIYIYRERESIKRDWDWVSKLNWKIEFLVPHSKYQNWLYKSLHFSRITGWIFWIHYSWPYGIPPRNPSASCLFCCSAGK